MQRDIIISSRDATGQAILAGHAGQYGFEVIERDDGYMTGAPADHYFHAFEDWPSHERKAMAYVKDRVLDIGCGAGRHALYLQQQTRRVTAIDISPLAVDVCRARGVKDARVLSIDDVEQLPCVYDTVLLLGWNWGLMGSYALAKKRLQSLAAVTAPGAVLIAESGDPATQTDDADIAYQQKNIKNGRLPGQRRIRIRYRQYKSAWFDYLGVSRDCMMDILKGSAWRLGECLESERGSYIALIYKT